MIKELTGYQYILRLLTMPFKGMEHRIKIGNQSPKYIRCGYDFSDHASDCLLCERYAYLEYWVAGAINRVNDEYSIYKLNTQTYCRIREIAKARGNPDEYDIEIIDRGNIVNQLAPTPLSANDLAIKAKVDTKLISNYIKPYPQCCIENFIRKNNLKMPKRKR